MNAAPPPAAAAAAIHLDLSPHAEADTEWWYCQGGFEGASTGRRNLVLLLFRRRGRRDTGKDGWFLLISVTDPAAGTQHVTSLATPEMADAFGREALADLLEGGVPKAMAEAYVDEILACGPAAPIVVSATGVEASPTVLDHRLEGFAIRQSGPDRIDVGFDLPGDGRRCLFALAPVTRWFRDSRIGAEGSVGLMEYASCPRVALAGDVGGEPVTGRVWFDHQWGGHGWFEPHGESGHMLGWAWLAINLDDGNDLLVSVAIDMTTREIVKAGAVWFEKGVEPRLVETVGGGELRRWRSERTHADYPVSWRIVIPELDADLVFSPAQDNCEIPIYGIPTAVWEGAGTIGGTLGGRPAAGRAHLELYGYAFPTDFDRFRDAWIDRIDALIAGFLPRRLDDDWLRAAAGVPRGRYDADALTRLVSTPAWTLLERGGKHWRSVFGILMLSALGSPVEPYEELVTVIPELLHAGSLMIDDIEDRSVLRRGGPAIHTIFGEPATINAGNALYFLPLLTVARNPNLDAAQREAIYRISFDLFVRAHLGQAQDLDTERWVGDAAVLADLDGRLDVSLQTYALKTAAPIRALTGVLCMIAAADERTTEVCMRYAETAGIAYQIVDDTNNFTGGARWGKETGEDIRERRLTYVVLRALKALPAAGRDRLWAILCADPASFTADMQAEACRLVEQSGVIERCREEARAMIGDAWTELSDVLPPSHSKLLLRLLVEQILEGAS